MSTKHNEMAKIQSKNRNELLDVIDEIRSIGVESYIALPQMIVVGDQSSGKSSLLEAISNVSFPVKDNLCTRFATELILRRTAMKKTTVTIIPEADALPDKIRAMTEFGSRTVDFNDFPQLYEDATAIMGIENGKKFSKDVLRIEICGPNQPHLTLIDLPGLFHADESDEVTGEANYVESLVLSYMRKPRSIILAVVSAKNDFALQIATKHTRKMDPHGKRTLGIITKPDTVHAGSHSEREWIQRARNEHVKFRLGWHVVRNRDFSERDSTSEMREAKEDTFFSEGAWGGLPKTHRGIAALLPRLSSVLDDQMQEELPGLVAEVDQAFTGCKSGLAKLGDKRTTLAEQQAYLHRLSHSFSGLIKAAIEGQYTDSFFGDPLKPDGKQKRLRAVVQNTLNEHAHDIRFHGHAMRILDDDEVLPVGDVVEDIDEKDGSSTKRDKNGCLIISRKQYIDTIVLPILRSSRGTELPGTFNPLIIGDLFYRQSRPWGSIVQACAKDLMEIARSTVMSTLHYTVDDATSRGILHHVIKPAMDQIRITLQQWVRDVMEPHERGHPITYNHYFTDNVQNQQKKRKTNALLKKLQASYGGNDYVHMSQQAVVAFMVDDVEPDMDRFAGSQAVDYMQAYYKVAQKTMIDNFSVLAVEKCLLQELPKIFSPDIVAALPDSVVQSIAAEPEDLVDERAQLETKLRTLEKTLRSLHRLDGYGLFNMTGSRDELGSGEVGTDDGVGGAATPDTKTDWNLSLLL